MVALFISLRTAAAPSRFGGAPHRTGPEQAVQITRNGGYGAIEAPDGRYLYYTKVWLSGPIWCLASAGGAEEMLGESIRSLRNPRNFAVTDTELYFAASTDPRIGFEICRYDFRTRKVRSLARVPTSLANGMSLFRAADDSPLALLFSMGVRNGSDLMLIENFSHK